MIYYFFLITLFLLSLILFKIFINISPRLNIIDKPNSLNIHKIITPTSGGIIFFIMLTIYFVLIYFFIKKTILLPNNYLVLLFSIIIIFLISVYDDIFPIHAVYKLIFQLLLIYFSLTTIQIDKIPLPTKLSLIAVLLIWVYLINTINFIDGVDGFLTVFAINFFLIVALVCFKFNYNILSKYFSDIFIIILLSFLIFNKPQAKLFMGDSGSILLGIIIGYCFLELYILGRWDVMISSILYPIIDCTLTIIKRILNKQAPWARLFDYYFLKPIKNKKKDNIFIFKTNLIFNLCILIITTMQIIYDLKFLLIINILITLYFINYYKKNS